MALLITEQWTNETHQAFFRMIRIHWRGRNPVFFEDRATQHKSPSSLALAVELGIEVRLLPRATPELSAMDHLWWHTKNSSRKPANRLDRRIGPRGLPVHLRPEPP